MSWLHVRVLDAPSRGKQLGLLYRGAEVGINTAAITCISRRQDGALNIEMHGKEYVVTLIMEYGAFPPIFR